jgi:hypothetical protein
VADSSQKNASASAGKSSSSSGKKVIMKNYSRQGSSLFSITLDSRRFYDFLFVTLPMKIFRVQRSSSLISPVQACKNSGNLCA